MRKINTLDFQIAKRGTSRNINRCIALNLIREHQPISRADLARRMNLGRGAISMLVNELISEDAVYEGALGTVIRGRKPVFLHVRTHNKIVVAVDIRVSRTFVSLSDFGGREIALESFETHDEPNLLVKELAKRIKRLLAAHNVTDKCEGIGVAVPGRVNYLNGTVLHAPTMNWRDVKLGALLTRATHLPVHVENTPKACALAQMWLGKRAEVDAFAYVIVSDGVGVGIVHQGELLRGQNFSAGEFGHIPLTLDGPHCLCGKRGCWEAYCSNLAIVSRYAGRDLTDIQPRQLLHLHTDKNRNLHITDVIARARDADGKALAALDETAFYLGTGLAMVANAIDPGRIFIGGEITAAWDIIKNRVHEAMRERAITETVAKTSVQVSTLGEYPRLRGATAILAAPSYAAPRVA